MLRGYESVLEVNVWVTVQTVDGGERKRRRRDLWEYDLIWSLTTGKLVGFPGSFWVSLHFTCRVRLPTR